MKSQRIYFLYVLLGIFAAIFSVEELHAQDMTIDNAYTFNPLAVKRDPFYPKDATSKKNINDLLHFDLNQMNLVAILTGMGSPQAMIVLPNSKTHIVQVGDPIGRHNGRVAKITANEVIVKETFKDFQNRVKTNLTNLVLAE